MKNIQDHWTAQDLAEELNDAARVEMAQTPGLWIGLLVEDGAHWQSIGIYSARQLAEHLDVCDAENRQEAEREASYGSNVDRYEWNDNFSY